MEERKNFSVIVAAVMGNGHQLLAFISPLPVSNCPENIQNVNEVPHKYTKMAEKVCYKLCNGRYKLSNICYKLCNTHYKVCNKKYLIR